MNGLIYILQDGKDLNTNIYKIGKTIQPIAKRIRPKGYIKNRLIAYSKNIVPLGLKSGANTILYQTYIVDQDILDKTESIIIKHFSNLFMKERGREWFKGDIKEMITEIELIIGSEYTLTTILKNYSEDNKSIENITCEFCTKIFTNKSNLLAQQKITKSCLEKQGIKNEDYRCEHCSKLLSNHKRLLTHIDVCKLKTKNELSKYKSLYENNDKKEKKCKQLLTEKEKEYKQLLTEKEKEYKQLLAEKEKEIILYNQQIQDLKNLLKEANNTIAEIAKQPKIVSNNDNRILN